MFQIIDITTTLEIPAVCHCYVAEPSAEVVAHDHLATYGYIPEVMYRRVASNGRISYYVPMKEPQPQGGLNDG